MSFSSETEGWSWRCYGGYGSWVCGSKKNTAHKISNTENSVWYTCWILKICSVLLGQVSPSFLLLWDQRCQKSQVIFILQKRCESLLTVWLCVSVCVSWWVTLPTPPCPYIPLSAMLFFSRIKADCWHYGSKDIVRSNLAMLIGVLTLVLCSRARIAEGILDTNQWEK